MVFPFSIESKWSFIDVVWQLVHHKSICSGLMEKVLSLCSEIWKDRNTIRNGGGQLAGNTMVKRSASLVEKYKAADERVSCMNPAVQVRWHPLDPPWFKMNVDGVVFTKLRATGTGMVLRDSQGMVLAAMSKRHPATLASLEVEAKSMEIAVQFVWEMGFREVYFKTNSSTLKNILTGTSKAPASIETITNSILAQMDKFHFVSFIHVKRDGNRPAHILAQFAKHVGDFVVWLEETPNLIEGACS
ncbi:uncharacterized protein LOC136070030 [Quercus suber]|uniref:uncharacterized protein LOC136070030 n=1 Tax=Quercus suber TaxID=58331 RepID=UPI0032E02A23